ncbi:MAG: binary toxin-like calcium binding domain-containing protein [Luteolibacter sp.]
MSTSNTRLVYELTDQTIWEQRRSVVTGDIIPNSTQQIAGIQGSSLATSTYSRFGDQRYFYTVDNNNPNLVRTYKLVDGGIDAAFTREHTLPFEVTPATVVATINPADGAALLYGDDSKTSFWLHDGVNGPPGSPGANVSVIPNSEQALPLYVTNEQCVFWENARAPLGDDGSIPNAIVTHYLRDTGTNVLSATPVNVQGKTLLNVSPFTPDFPYWLISTAEKTGPDTSRLRTYRLTSPLTTDRDNDGLLDAYETNTGTYVDPTNTGTDPTDPDTDGDGLFDGDEVFPFVMIDGSFTWGEAALDAEARGGHLATITNGVEDAGLQRKFGSTSFFPKWLGASDAANEGSYAWVTGEPFTATFIDPDTLAPYSKWSSGQPDNLNDSDGLVLNANFLWADDQLSELRGYLLERPSSNPNLVDTDGDGLTDAQEAGFLSDPRVVDTDGDGLTDFEEFNLGTNPLLVDTDNDGILDFDEVNSTFGYLTDPLLVDTDGDGLDDWDEYTFGTDPTVIDTDGDGLSDGDEVYGSPATDPLIPDTDGDGLTDGEEFDIGTDPTDVDTDGDGISDFDEFSKGSDPLDPIDPLGLDSDGDGLSDYDELFVHGTDPLNPDTDGDGLTDFEEVDGINGFTSDPLLVDTDGDGFSDYDEVFANPPTDPNDFNEFPPSANVLLHNRPEPSGATEVSIDLSFGPFGHRPETDKSSEDGSVALRDVNGVIVWVTNQGDAAPLPNSALGKTLFVSNTECVVWSNRYDGTYNARGSQSLITIYRRDVAGGLVVADPIAITGTLLETCAISPATFGFTVIGCEAQVSTPIAESRQRYVAAVSPEGVISYAIRDVDVWDERLMTGYRITFDGQLQVLGTTLTYIPRNIGNASGVRLVGSGTDASALFSMTTARDLYDDVDDVDPGIFKSQNEGFWATWNPNIEQIVSLASAGLSPVLDPLSESIYVSNSKLIVETAETNLFTELPTGNYVINELSQRPNGIIEIVSSTNLPDAEKILPLSIMTRPGTVPYFYVISEGETELSLYKADGGIQKLGDTIVLPNRVSPGANYARNPLDASLLVKTDGDSGLVWIPSRLGLLPAGNPDALPPVLGLYTPVSLPESSLASAMFVSSIEAVGWMNSGAPVDIANGGVVPLAKISHFARSSNGEVISTELAPPALGRYVAIPSSLSTDAETEGWYLTTFEKTGAQIAQLRSYVLRTSQSADSDRDGLLDVDELAIGSDPSNTDSDADGIKDGQEVYPYYLIGGSYTYEQARLDAVSRGGRLAVVDTVDKQKALKRIIGVLELGDKSWLGGGDPDGPSEANGTREGQYRWVDETGRYFDDNGLSVGSPLNQVSAAWTPGQPSNAGNADGLVLRSDYDWEMAPLVNRYSYIIEYPVSDPTLRDTDNDSLTEYGSEFTDFEEIQIGANPGRIDTDGDGITDPLEVYGYSWNASASTFIRNSISGSTSNPLLVDSDGDGIDDDDEVRLYGTNPQLLDTDNDGLTDLEEIAGSVGSDPNLSDTDGDGFTDYEEITAAPPTDPNDPNSRPGPGQLVPPNPNMHDQVEFLGQQQDVSIPDEFSPFGNRADYNRYGDDGSAMLLDVNGVLLWRDAEGSVRIVPESEYAVPLFVSGTEAIVWTNAFDPARVLAQAGELNSQILVSLYRIDPDSGEIGIPTQVAVEGSDVLPTAPITTTSEAYTLVTFDHFGETADPLAEGSSAYIYRMSFTGNAQLVSQISIPNLQNRIQAAQGVHVIGHGSDGTVVFSIDPRAWFDTDTPNTPRQLFEDGVVTPSWYVGDHRRLFLINGSIPGPNGVVNELSASTRIENLGDGSLPPTAYYTSKERVVYQISGSAGIKDARLNPVTGSLVADELLLLPQDFGSALQITTQTRVGDERWIYSLSEDRQAVKVYRLANNGPQLAYTAAIPIGFEVDDTAYVSQINPLDGSAIIKATNSDMLWVFNNQRPGTAPNAVGLSNSSNARALFVHRNEVVLWGNANQGANNLGILTNVEVRHYEQLDGRLVNPTDSFSNLSFKFDGRFILGSPPFTPDFSQWTLTTTEKVTATAARFWNYRLTTYNSLDTDTDSLPDKLEVVAGSNAFIADSDGDGLADGDELYPYYVIDGSYTWEQARADALARGGRLAAITNQDDYTALRRKFASLNRFDLWLGATDEMVEGNWVTVAGTSLSLVNWRLPSTVLDWSDYYEAGAQIRVPWAIGKPNNAGNADGLVLNSDLEFEDRPQSELRGYIIEFPRTDPANEDTDGDGIVDGDEVGGGTDPTVADPFTGVPDITPGDNNSGSQVVNFRAAGIATTYEGLWFDPDQGHVYYQRMKLSSSGKFSSKITGIAAGLKGSLKGKFTDSGYYFESAPRRMPNVITAELQLFEETPGKWIIIGRMQTSANKVIGVELRPSQYGKALPCPYQGTYSMQLVNLNAGSVGPRGDGVAVVFVNRIGQAKMKVFLPDGLRASYNGSIVSNDLLAFRMLTHRGQSAIIGPMKFGSQKVDRDIEGSVRFVSGGQVQGGQYPGGFDQTRDANGCLYTQPVRGFLPIDSIPIYQYNTVIDFLGGDLGGVAEAATWNPNNKIILPVRPDRKAKFVVSKKTGLIKYTYNTSDIIDGISNINARGYAILHQKSGLITGYYDTRASNGLITLAANDGTLPEITIVTPRTKSIDKSAEVYTVDVQTSGLWEFVLPDELIVDTDSGEVAWATVEIINGNYVIDPGDDTTPSLLSNSIGDGNGTIRITVLENDTFQQRQAHIEIAGVKHRLEQDYR